MSKEVLNRELLEGEACPMCQGAVYLETAIFAGVREASYYECDKGCLPDQWKPQSPGEE